MKLSECRVGAEAEAAAWLCRWIVPYSERIVTVQVQPGPREQWANGESLVLHQLEALLTVRILINFKEYYVMTIYLKYKLLNKQLHTMLPFQPFKVTSTKNLFKIKIVH